MPTRSVSEEQLSRLGVVVFRKGHENFQEV